ncbi:MULTISPECIES: ABC transporter permease [unclassified Helicobacter]|uniref:ABC transporter permease n=1 Tax=unclassified Helicobacter TaxID=2593540 RepID=UPI000CF167E0|nr:MULTISPECIES: ABC transporter permease [unclassified Helicobacter]
MILNAFFLAFKQIRKNYLRAFLTMLGIIIGVGSVIVMIALGNGTTKMITQQISSLGSNLLIIMPARGLNTGGGSLKRNFSMQEVNNLKMRLQGYKAIAPVSSSSTLAQFQGSNTQTTINGVTKEYFEVTEWKVSMGRHFKDNEYAKNVCVLGQSVKKALFNEANPLGSQVRISKIVCEVVGVLESKGQGAMGQDQDDVILIPFKVFNRSISGTNSIFNINRIFIALKDTTDSTQATQEVKNILREVRSIKAGQLDTFEVMDTKEIQKTLQSTTKTLTLFLGAVASVSLFVGGIGIMNIMLVSVTERTKEIGTRLAIGALASDVLLQFLIESIVISAFGGIIGITLAFLISLYLSFYMQIPFVFDIWVAIGAFLFSAIVGIIFGFLPARRASKLDPIQALRYE